MIVARVQDKLPQGDKKVHCIVFPIMHSELVVCAGLPHLGRTCLPLKTHEFNEVLS